MDTIVKLDLNEIVSDQIRHRILRPKKDLAAALARNQDMKHFIEERNDKIAKLEIELSKRDDLMSKS